MCSSDLEPLTPCTSSPISLILEDSNGVCKQIVRQIVFTIKPFDLSYFIICSHFLTKYSRLIFVRGQKDSRGVASPAMPMWVVLLSRLLVRTTVVVHSFAKCVQVGHNVPSTPVPPDLEGVGILAGEYTDRFNKEKLNYLALKSS